MPEPELRAFHVRLREAGAHGGLVVREPSFEAAVLAFAEAWTPHDQLAVIVCEVETGHERCFRLDLGAGQAAPCEAAP
jgi:hypothetical protein